MKEIIIGTSNLGKIDKMKYALSGLDIIVSGVDKETIRNFTVNETGETALENARIKALAYAKVTGKVVLSNDSAVYIDGLHKKTQPGIKVRRINGKENFVSDEELIDHYSKIVHELGGEATMVVEDGICMANPDGSYYETTIISKRKLVSKPSATRTKGHPLDSLQIDSKTGKYFSEMTHKEKDAMWKGLIGKKLLEFVKETLPKL